MRLSTRKKVFFSLILLVSLFGFSELVLRIRLYFKYGCSVLEYTDDDRRLYLPHPYLRMVLKPGADTILHGTRVKINSLGLRGLEIEAVKPKGKIRILCLGGSTTFSVGVKDYENAWPRLLEKKLRAKFSKLDIEVLNAGVPGYNSNDSLINYELRMMELKPDFLVIYHGINDIQACTDRNFQPDFGHLRKQHYASDKAKGLEWWSYRFLTLNKVKRFMDGFGKPTSVFEENRKYAVDDNVSQRTVETLRRNLTTLFALAKGRGTQPVFATFSICYNKETMEGAEEKELGKDWAWYAPTLSREGLLNTLDALNIMIQALGNEKGAPVADLRGTIPSGKKYFTDLVHFTEEGEELAAQAFEKALTPFLESRP